MADEEAVRRAFSHLDADNNGLITYEELESVFSEIGGFATKEELRKIIASVSDTCVRQI